MQQVANLITSRSGDLFTGEVTLNKNDTIIISGSDRDREIPFDRFTIKIIENSKDGETT